MNYIYFSFICSWFTFNLVTWSRFWLFSKLRPETSSRHRGQAPTGPLKLEEMSTTLRHDFDKSSMTGLPGLRWTDNTGIFRISHHCICYNAAVLAIESPAKFQLPHLLHQSLCQQDCQSNNFPSWQDRFFSCFSVKLRSSLIEAMAERYMESPESPAFFTVGSFYYQQNCNCTTAWTALVT